MVVVVVLSVVLKIWVSKFGFQLILWLVDRVVVGSSLWWWMVMMSRFVVVVSSNLVFVYLFIFI